MLTCSRFCEERRVEGEPIVDAGAQMLGAEDAKREHGPAIVIVDEFVRVHLGLFGKGVLEAPDPTGEVAIE